MKTKSKKRSKSKHNKEDAQAEEVAKKANLTPEDLQSIERLLGVMDVKSYDPLVVNQLLEFTYKYVTDVLSDAVCYAEHANRSSVCVDDVRIAVDAKLNHTFTQPPSREDLLELAKKKNSTALPLVPTTLGVHLPPQKYRLTNFNFQVHPVAAVAAPTPTQATTSTTNNQMQLDNDDNNKVKSDNEAQNPPPQPTNTTLGKRKHKSSAHQNSSFEIRLNAPTLSILAGSTKQHQQPQPQPQQQQQQGDGFGFGGDDGGAGGSSGVVSDDGLVSSDENSDAFE